MEPFAPRVQALQSLVAPCICRYDPIGCNTPLVQRLFGPQSTRTVGRGVRQLWPSQFGGTGPSMNLKDSVAERALASRWHEETPHCVHGFVIAWGVRGRQDMIRD